MPRHRSFAALLLVAALVLGCAGAAGPAGQGRAANPPSPEASVGRGDDTAGEPMPSVVIPSPAARASPSARPSPSPAPTATPAPSVPTEPFAMNLYRKGDFVGQYTFEWCVGASIQMTLNMTRPADDRSRALQQDLWEMARDFSNSPFGGASPIGWTKTLNEVGAGPYRLVSLPTLETALATAAAAIRETERPVGLVMWSGRHAWMVSGFTSQGDPATDEGFRVTGLRVLDPLYPHGSRQWGASPPPNSLLTPDEVGDQFVARLGGRVNLGVAPGYLLILPVAVV